MFTAYNPRTSMKGQQIEQQTCWSMSVIEIFQQL